MRVLSAASVLVTLVFCTAEDIVPRWSKPDDNRSQGEWVPLKSDRISQQPIRIPSAITPSRHNHERAYPQQSPANQYVDDYLKQQTLASHTAPQRISYPQDLGQQQFSQEQLHQIPPQLPTQLQPQLQQQLDSQQVLAQFLNQQIQQASLPAYNRALLQKQSVQNPHYFTQPNQFSVVPVYNQGQLVQNEQYTESNERETNGKLLSNENAVRQAIPDGSYEKGSKTYIGEPFNGNFSSAEDSNQKEEVQILYVPVEMLKQQEQNARSKSLRKPEQNRQQMSKEFYNPVQRLQTPENSQINPKESRKFRHPIQPLKEQVPAYHIKQPMAQGSTLYPNPETINEEIKGVRQLAPNQDYVNHKPHPHAREEYIQKYASSNSNLASSVPAGSGSKEQNVDESTIKDEISDYRHKDQDRNNRKDYINQPEPSLPPPNQPPLSVFMEKTASSRVGDLIGLLRGSKTIPVLDSIGPVSPQVFVGPSNLHTPSGYIKYELPYLSSLDNYQTGNKLSQVPFFVAPLNFQPPPGFAKIPFPPPHIGSVVLSNITQQSLPVDQQPIPKSNSNLRSSNYNKEGFTIPADISSISPQLPSLINSLQEEEYSSTSSTEALPETTEATPLKQRRPGSNPRRFNSRGSQRGSVSYSSTTKNPVSRQRRPVSRNPNHRINHYTDVVTNVPETPGENHYDTDPNYFHYKSNKDASESAEKAVSEQKLRETPQLTDDDRNHLGIQYTSNIENVKQEETSRETSNPNFDNQNPLYSSKFSNDDTVVTTSNRGPSGAYYSSEAINKNLAHSSSPQYHNTPSSGETYDEYQTTNYNDKHNNLTPTDKQYSVISTTRKYDEPTPYHQGTHSPSTYSEESPINSEYKDINYRQRLRDNISKSPEQDYSYRQKEQKGESPHAQDADYSREVLNREKINFQVNAREQQHQPIEGIKHFDSPYSSYSNEEQSTTPFIQKASYENLSQESLEAYRDHQLVDKQSDTVQKNHNYQDVAQTTSKNDDYNGRPLYDSNVSEPQKATTERTFPTRSRSRGRGRPHHQYKQTSTESSVNSNEESDDSSHYTKPDITTSPGRRYSHSRAHRRPLRPTAGTTTSTTTNSPPGTKYLIRTRRPTVPQTKLQTGRGRIRRPTRPTTTVPTTTTEHLQTLPVLWQQPHRLSPSQNDYRMKEGIKQTQSLDSSEYIEETPQYSDERLSDKSTYEPQNERSPDVSQGNLKQYPEADAIRRAPNYSYETQEEPFIAQKQLRTTPPPYYSDEYETTPKTLYSRNYQTTQKKQYYREYETTQKPQYSKEYETTQKTYYPRDYVATQKPQHSKEYETTQKMYYPRDYVATQKPQYSKEYETTQKTYYPRDYEATQKVHHSRDYETTQKPQYPRDYETTLKPLHSREYETTQKPQYSRDYETTPKPQYYRELETTPKPQYYREYETTQNPSHFRDHESNANPKFYNDYDTTKKTIYSDDYETTEKTKSFKGANYYDTTKKTVSYEDYETTPRPPVSEADTNQKQSYEHSSRQAPRNSSQRKKPSTIPARIDATKQTKDVREEAPVKNPDTDYWNQGVTIQQSQSYVFNPDETYSEERQTTSPRDSKYESSQNDYEDYYTQESEQQYSSDQAPFPSNEQRITYTQIKPNEYTGKASQYPSKDDRHNFDSIQVEKETESKKSDFTVQSNLNKTGESLNEKQILVQEQQASTGLIPESEEITQSSKAAQVNKRKGTWVRRKIKKPKDLFETAESQYSAVRENALLMDITPKEQQIENYTKYKLNGKHEETNGKQIETSLIDVNNKSLVTNDSKSISSKSSRQEENSGLKEKKDSVLSKVTMAEITTMRDDELNTFETPTVTTLSWDPENSSEPYRTSTTTEISLETEICYKGQCIKTKRRKEDGNTVLNPAIEP